MMQPHELECVIPDFEYDALELEQLADTYLVPQYRDLQICYSDDKAYPDNTYREYESDSGHNRWCMLLFPDLPDDLSDLPIVAKIHELFGFCESQSTRQKVYENLFFFDIWGELRFHIDHPKRSFAFNIPIRGCEEPTQWWCQETHGLMHQAEFKYPMMINTEVMHGCPNNSGQRLFLSLDGFQENLSDVRSELISQGKIQEELTT